MFILSFNNVSLCAVDAWTIAFSSDSRFIASGSHTGKIILYGVESGQREVQLDTRGGKFALSIAYVSRPSLGIKILRCHLDIF